MRATYLDQLAALLVHYSIHVQPGQLIRITADPVGQVLAEACFEAVVRAGGHPHIRLQPANCEQILLELGNEEQLCYESPLLAHEAAILDGSIGIWGTPNTRHLSSVDPRRQAQHAQARSKILKTLMERSAEGSFHWVGTEAPTESAAQDAGMSLRDYERFLIRAGKLDTPDPVAVWQEMGRRQQQLVDFLQRCHTLHFWTPQGTDLTVDISNMFWCNSCGKHNFPDGEVFTGPNLQAANGGVEGVVAFSFPAVHHGHEVRDITLRFEKGEVVEATASSGLAFLESMLHLDPGAKRVGEIAIGTNFGIQQFMRNTLFDEKIGGTFHLALGAGYPETGNTNQSALHWDLVCDLRQGGWIRADGKEIMRDGQFLSPFDILHSVDDARPSSTTY